MEHQRRRVRAAMTAGALASALAAMLLTGCGPLDRGAAEEAAFTDRFTADPAVAEVDVTGHTKLPWTGTVSGTVTAQPGLDDREVEALVHRIGGYIVDTKTGASIPNMGLTVDGARFRVAHDRDWNERVLAVALDLREDPDLLGSDLYVTSTGTQGRLTLTSSRPEAIPDLTARWAEPLSRLAGGTDDTLVVQDEHHTFGVQGPPGDWSEPGFAAWRAVEESFTVTRFSLKPDSLELKVARESDIDEARRIAVEALGAAEDTRVTVSGGILDLADYSNGEAARAVLDRLSPEAAERVVRAWSDDHTTGDTALSLWVDAPEGIGSVAREIATLPESEAFTAVGVGFEAGAGGDGAGETDGTGGLGIEASPAELAVWTDHLERIRAETGAVRLRLNAQPIQRANKDPFFDIGFATVPSDDELASLARTLRPLMPESGQIVLALGGDVRLSLFADPLIDPEQPSNRQWWRYSAPFAEAWNEASEG